MRNLILKSLIIIVSLGFLPPTFGQSKQIKLAKLEKNNRATPNKTTIVKKSSILTPLAIKPAVNLHDSILPKPSVKSLLKFKTTPQDPEHRCYEIVAPISSHYEFKFHFMSLQKYVPNTSP
ncbi:MAG: hypothetical protein D6813_02560 [Calditrichaeota bacterium]|nr:MAG: hypothetical protein D6813_02560 [Calditrichota bacterium]